LGLLLVGILATIGVVALTVYILSEDEGEVFKPEPTSKFPSPIVFEFNKFDDKMCQKNFRQSEESYASSYISYRRTESKFNELYANILENMDDYSVALVDNQEFLHWAKTTPNMEMVGSETKNLEKDPDLPSDV